MDGTKFLRLQQAEFFGYTQGNIQSGMLPFLKDGNLGSNMAIFDNHTRIYN
jgi:hypothetical protein